jgi:fatty-acid desaturase
MKYLSASSLTVGIINIVVTLGAILGFFYFEFSAVEIATTIFFYFMYSAVGLGMMYHRFWTHRSFEFKHQSVKWLLTLFGVLTGRGSIIGWVHVHREHHAFSDTERDPHISNMSLLKIFVPMFSNHGETINKRLIKDLLTKEHLDINKYYVLIIATWVITLMMINPWLAYFIWFLPVFITNLVWNSFIYYGHSSKIGYQNYTETNDHSTNSWIYALLILGEGWHNNHHKYANKQTTKIKPWEVDPLYWLIRLVKHD